MKWHCQFHVSNLQTLWFIIHVIYFKYIIHGFHEYCKGAECWVCIYVGWYNISLQYLGYHCTNLMFLHVDNSGSPSIVEQSQQRHDSSCYTLLAVVPSPVKYPIPYACQLAPCSMGISCCILLFLYVHTFSVFFSSTTTTIGALQPLFYSGCFLIEPWDSLSDYVYPGIACLACQLGRCILG